MNICPWPSGNCRKEEIKKEKSCGTRNKNKTFLFRTVSPFSRIGCAYVRIPGPETSEGRCKKRKVKLFKGFYFPFSPRSTPPLHFSAAKIEGFSPREDEDLGRGWRRGWFMQEGCYRSTVSCYAVQCVPCSYIKWSSSSSSLLCVASGKKMFPWFEQDRKVEKDHQWWNCVIGFFRVVYFLRWGLVLVSKDGKDLQFGHLSRSNWMDALCWKIHVFEILMLQLLSQEKHILYPFEHRIRSNVSRTKYVSSV